MKQSQTAGALLKAALATILLLGILLLGLCPLSSAQSNEPSKPVACEDNTPHKVQFVTVAPGVRLEVLDWGGSGEVMVLLTGSGDNAHVYDYFAFQFTHFFHVIGITRRGWLPSSQPDTGYDVGTWASDDIKVLDALDIKNAVFVAHSIGGAELSTIGAKYPSYVDKLIYMDASDLSERYTFPDIPSAFSLYTEAASRSVFDLQAFYARLLGVREPVAAICLSFEFNQGGTVAGTSTPDSIQEQLLAGVSLPDNPPTNWADIKAPRLGIFAPPTAESKVPWYWYLSPADQAVFDERFPLLIHWYTNVIGEFSAEHPESPTPTVLLLPGAPHYIFINNETEVVRAMRNFLGIPSAAN